MIGIIGAMDVEIDEIKKEMKNIEEIKINRFIFYKGLFNNKAITLVKSGIGMVNASIITTTLINKFNVNKIYFSGVAGSVNEKVSILDIVIADSLQEYLFDVTSGGFGYDKGIIAGMKDESIFKPNILLEEAKNKLKDEKIYYGKIVSGDKFVSLKTEKIEIGREFDALAVDMESAAVAHTCYLLNVDFLIIRSISDSVTDASAIEFEKFVVLASKKSKEILKKLI